MKDEPNKPKQLNKLPETLPESSSQLLDRSGAAKFLGVKKNTLALWAMRKKPILPYIKVGRLIRYKLSDLEEFLEQNTKIKSTK